MTPEPDPIAVTVAQDAAAPEQDAATAGRDPTSPPIIGAPAAVPARSRGVIALVEENCTVCMLCVRECPDWCIEIEAHDETVDPPGGGRPRVRHVLDRFAIDFGLCLYCGICVEVCPFDALLWASEASYAEADVRDLVHEQERLGGWVEGVPVPPALDPAAEEAREVDAARRAGARGGQGAGGRPG